LAVLGTAPLHAAVTCSSTQCEGPANELIKQVTYADSMINLLLTSNSSTLNCNVNTPGAKTVKMSSAQTPHTLAIVLSAIAMNRTLRIVPTTGGSGGLTALCNLSSLQLIQ